MGVEIAIVAPGKAQADALAVTVAQPLDGVDDRLSGVAGTGELRGDRGEALLLRDNGTRLVAAGIGKREEVDRDALRTAGAAAAHQLARVGGTLAWRLDERLPLPPAEQAAALVEGTVIGGYTPGRWKTKEDGRPKPIERIVLETGDDVRAEAERAALLAERTNRARDLANMPPNELYPETLAQQAAALADEHEHLTATARTGRPSAAIAPMPCSVPAPPAMSPFIASMPLAGLMEMPPVSKVIDLPTSPSTRSALVGCGGS